MPEATAERILEAAERIFAEKGYDGTSIRAIARKADCNVASANYHFKNKETLIKEMIARRVIPINEQRFEMLRKLKEEHKAEPIPKDALINVLLRPIINSILRPDGGLDSRFLQLIARSISDPSPFLQALHEEFFNDLSEQILSEFIRHYPRKNPTEKMEFLVVLATATIGSITIIPSILQRLDKQAIGINAEQVLNELVCFLARGLPES